jgi:hypothetical protein
MASITLVIPPMAMATTQFARVIGYEVSAPWQSEPTTGRQILHLNWVVVTDKNGSRRLRNAVGKFRKLLRRCRPLCNIP